MRTRFALITLFSVLTAWSCSPGPADGALDDATHSHGGDAHTHAATDASVAVTFWGSDLELFMEHPTLEVGHASRFAVHLTKLEDFKPLSDGPVLFRFSKPGGKPKIVTVGAPTSPGIFGPTVTFDEPGSYDLHVEVLTDQLETSLDLGPLVVLDKGASPEVPEAAAGDDAIAYLKEQQWKLPFATEEVRNHNVDQTLRVSAQIIPKMGSEALVLASVGGRYHPPPNGVPGLGRTVRKGTTLGSVELLPLDQSTLVGSQVSTGITLSQLSQQVVQAETTVIAERSRLELAQKEAERAERLVTLDALPQRRLEQAQSEVQIRQSVLNAAEQVLLSSRETLERYDSARTRISGPGNLQPLTAPITGVVVESSAVAGAHVGGSKVLFRLVNLDRVWARGEVYERDAANLGSLKGARLELPGREPIELDARQLVLIGDVIDPGTRTLPVLWELSNSEGALKLGNLGHLRLRTGVKTETIAVPRSAVFLEENRSIVYVQLGGETFQRRLVKTGIDDGTWVEITEGLGLGEHIVTTGGYDVALAGRSSEIPDHGHVH